MKLLTLIVVFMGLPVLGSSQDIRVEIGNFPVSAGMLRDDEIYLRNVSTVDLGFWLSLDGGEWTEYWLPSGHAARMREGVIRVAIATALESEDDSDGPPPLSPGLINAVPSGEGAWFYRTIEGGSRAELCWASAVLRWRVEVNGDSVCD